MSIRNLVTDSINGASFVTISTETVPTVRKTVDIIVEGKKPIREANPHHGRVTKVTTGLNVMVFTNQNSNGYDNMVKRRLEKEGKNPESFELSDRKWGTRVPNLPIVEHKGEDYLEVIVLNAGETKYLLDGKEVSKDEIVGLSATKKPSQADLDDKVIVRTFKESSIREIKINKETHKLNG